MPVVLCPLGSTWPKAAASLSGRTDLNQGAGPWRGQWLKCHTPVPAPPKVGLTLILSLGEKAQSFGIPIPPATSLSSL